MLTFSTCTNTTVLPHLANEEDVMSNNSVPQCLSSLSWFFPKFVSYLSSGRRELYEAAKWNTYFLKPLFNFKSMGILPLMGQEKSKAHNVPHTISLKDFNPTLINGHIKKYKWNTDTVKLTDDMEQMDLTNIYRTFHPNQKNIPSSQHLMVPSPKLTI